MTLRGKIFFLKVKCLVSQHPFADLALQTGAKDTVASQVVLVPEVPGLVFPQA